MITPKLNKDFLYMWYNIYMYKIKRNKRFDIKRISNFRYVTYEKETGELRDISYWEAKQFNNLIQKIDYCDSKKLIFRGDISNVTNYINKGIFVVGIKAQDFTNKLRGEYYKERNLSSKQKIIKIKEYSKMINIMIEKCSELSGIFKIESLDMLQEEKIEHHYRCLWEIIHNKGSAIYLKNSSPYCSFTDSFDTAKYFSETRAKIADSNFIIIGYIDSCNYNDNNKYSFTHELNDYLKKMGIEWYLNTHKEIMFYEGVISANILSVLDFKNKKLIINYRLIDEMEYNSNLDLEKIECGMDEVEFERVLDEDSPYNAYFILHSDGSRTRRVKSNFNKEGYFMNEADKEAILKNYFSHDSMKIFVKYFDCWNDLKIYDTLLDEEGFTENSVKQRINRTKKIFENELEFKALDFIIKAKKVDKVTKKLAVKLKKK